MSKFFQSKRALRIYGTGVLCTAAVCTVLRLLCILFFFDTDIGYYISGAVLPTVLNIVLFVATVGAFALCMIPQLRLAPVFPSASHPVRRFALLPAAGFAVYAVIYLMWLADYAEIYGTVPFSYILTEIASIGACVFFCLISVREKNDDAVFLLMGALTVIWLVIALADCYFDTLVQMNSPNKLIFQFACLGAMLLAVNELRQGFDVKRKGFHLFSASVALIFTLCSSVPSAIGYFMEKMPVAYSLIYSDTVFLLIAVFSAVRLIQLCFGKEQITVDGSTEDLEEVCNTEIPATEGESLACDENKAESTDTEPSENTEQEEQEN